MDQNQFAVSQVNNPESLQQSMPHNVVQDTKHMQHHNENIQNQNIQQNQESMNQNKRQQEHQNRQIQIENKLNNEEDNQNQFQNQEEKQDKYQNQLSDGYQQVGQKKEQFYSEIQNNHNSQQEKLPSKIENQGEQKHQKTLLKLSKNQKIKHGDDKTTQQNKYKAPQKSQQFLWGQDQQENKNANKKKRSYSQFFINNNKLAKSQQIYKSKNQNFGKKQKNSKIELPRQLSKNTKDEIDIWQDLRNSMLEKSRVSNVTLEKNKKIKPNKKQVAANEINKIEKLSRSKSKKTDSKIRNIIKLTKQEQNSVVGNIQDMSKLILEKVQKWKKQNKKIESRRLEYIQNQQTKIQIQRINEMEKIKNKVQSEKQLRLKAITQRLQKKQKKQRKITTSPQKYDRKKGYKDKKSKSEKQYKNIRQVKSVQIKQKKQVEPQEFSINWKRHDKDVIQQKQKLERRKIFQQKIRQIPINVSSNKKLKLLIEIDKSQNPLKYQLLQKKGLDDEQIYRNKKQFKLPQSPKKIGIQYLQDLREKSKNEDLRRYMSQQSLLNLKKYERDWKSPNFQLQKYTKQKKLEKLPPIFNPHNVEYKKRKLQEQDNQYLFSLKK